MRYVTGASIVSAHGERNAPALHTPYDTRSTGEGETINVITTTDRQLGPDSSQVVFSNDILLPATLTSQGDDSRTILHAMATLLPEIPHSLLKQGFSHVVR